MEAVNNSREVEHKNILHELSGGRVNVHHHCGYIDGILQVRIENYVVHTKNAFVQFNVNNISSIIDHTIYLR